MIQTFQQAIGFHAQSSRRFGFETVDCSVVLCRFTFLSSIQSLRENGFQTKEKAPTQKTTIQSNKTLNDFVIGNHTNASAIGNETLGSQINTLSNIFGRTTIGENSLCQDQVVKKDFDDKIRKAADNEKRQKSLAFPSFSVCIPDFDLQQKSASKSLRICSPCKLFINNKT